jgi:hypothetical protein
MNKRIHIFRAGTHRAMNGQELTFTEADIAAMAAAYDPKLHEAPGCVGHPQHDAPAYCWAEKLIAEKDGLWAEIGQVDPAFAEMVDAGRFKKISAAFYPPTDPANPDPGKYYLRHIGFLGAQPPAVKGLRAVAFAAGDGYLAFADWNLLDIVSVFRGLRDFIIEKFGVEDADRLIPAWMLDNIQNSAAQPDADPAPAVAYAELASDPAIAAARAKLDSDRRQLDADRLAFAERQAADRRTADGAFVDDLVRQGRLLPAQKSGMLAFMEATAKCAPIAFGEGAARIGITPAAFFRQFLAALPKQVMFGEVAPAAELAGEVQSTYVAPPGYTVDAAAAATHAAALQYQEANQGVTFIEAVKAVSRS